MNGKEIQDVRPIQQESSRLESNTDRTTPQYNQSSGTIRYFSMFTGVGGFELGIGDKAECIGFSEIDKYAIATYQKHYPTHHNYGDITKIDTESLPYFDCLV